jgi:sugar/nucleoside kinase (ribokinase family)
MLLLSGERCKYARGIAGLQKPPYSLRVWYLGAIGADSAGEILRLLLRKREFHYPAGKNTEQYGVSLVLVPDQERTMCTYLGPAGN